MLASSKQKSEFLLYHSSQLATLRLILTSNTIVLNIINPICSYLVVIECPNGQVMPGQRHFLLIMLWSSTSDTNVEFHIRKMKQKVIFCLADFPGLSDIS